ncbi:MAG: translation elongation factor 4 [Lentisphaeria bacterium]|jgi:GTP-binding protein LepA|nr:translation elongation factor 4 [Lentisphaeria bacterium]
MSDPKYIRNFSIIAHIDHGKSTLADRLMVHTDTIDERSFQDQLLDDMELERERGITIKSHPVIIEYEARDGHTYTLNLIDTPGHVDFSYEVSRSLAACEGALMLIDAAQGVQAQTVANVNLAMRQNLTIVPIINKIDLPAADVDMCYEQLEEILTIPHEEAILASAKDGTGIEEILEAITQRVPPPRIVDDIVRALIFDSVYDAFRGVVNLVRVVSGSLKRGDRIQFFATGQTSDIKEVGVFTPEMQAVDELSAGAVGYVIANIKTPDDSKIGDTITSHAEACTEPLPGFQEMQPMVYSGIYPIETADYENLKYSLSKLRLNDSAFVYQAETSAALGFGFRCGFLGLLHMDIVQERLRREYDMDIIATYPSVIYHVYSKNGEMKPVDNPVFLPDPNEIDRIEEPMVNASIISPSEYIGVIMNLVLERRGLCQDTSTVDQHHVMLQAELPLHEIVIDFHDRLKTITRGYGSMDYESGMYRVGPMVKLEMLVNKEPVDAFATIVHRDRAASRGRQMAERLKEVVPRHLFQIAIQAVVGSKVVARETVRALRKDVTAKCYGGDITRKRKLLEKQKEGKKRMKQVGKVNIPQDAFIKILQTNTD